MRSLRAFTCATSALALCFALSVSPRAQDPAFCLTILHNNDAESRLVNAGAGLEDFGGAARFIAVLERERRDARRNGCKALTDADVKRGTIVLNAGDNLLPGPEAAASTDLPEGQFYDTRVIDRARYDAIAIGNHEFDFGPDVLELLIADTSARIPFLSANLDVSAEPELDALAEDGRIRRSRIIWRRGERIGVIGATTPQLEIVSSHGAVTSGSVITAVNSEVERLRARGVDKLILLTHIQPVGANLVGLSLLSGIDVAVAGGGGEVLANEGNFLLPGEEASVFGPYPLLATSPDGTEIPVVTTAGDFRYVGRLEVLFDAEGNVLESAGRPVRVAGGDHQDAVTPDPIMQATVVEPVVAFNQDLADDVVGTSEVPLNGIRRDVRTRETNLGNLIADAELAIARGLAAGSDVPQPDIAIQHGGGIRNETVIPPGPILALTTFQVLPFPNALAVVEGITPELLELVLENAVSGVADFSGRFAQVAGFSFVYDPDAPAQTQDDDGNILSEGERVLSATLDDGTPIIADGEAVAGAPTLDLATTDFLARGGDGYPLGDLPLTVLDIGYEQALRDHIATNLGGRITGTGYRAGGEGRITVD